MEPKLKESAIESVSYSAPLKLRVADAEDLSVIASLLQDAVLFCGDISWDKKQSDEDGRFIIVLSRFCWEKSCADEKSETYHRVHSAFIVDQVQEAQYYGFQQSQAELMLSILTLELAPVNQLTVYFSGGAVLRLKIKNLNALLTDLSDPYATPFQPRHSDD